MKKSIFGLLLCCFLIGVLYADDYTLPNVDSRYIGTYIPVDVDFVATTITNVIRIVTASCENCQNCKGYEVNLISFHTYKK